MTEFLKNFDYKKNIYLLYLIYTICISVLSLIFAFLLVEKNYYFIDTNFNIILDQIPFNWGPLANNINENFNFYSLVFEKKYYLKKFPLNAILIVIIFNISKNIFIFLLIKNILTSSIIFLSIYFFSKSKKINFLNFLLLLSAFLLVPYNTSVIFNFVYADHLTSFLIPLIFIFLISNLSNKYLFIGLTIFVLYFTKPSVFFICLIIPLIILILEGNKKAKYIPVIFAFFAVIIWGTYGYYKTNVFPFGAKLLSNNSYDFSAITHENFKEVYPDKSVDELVQNLDINQFPEYKQFDNEWDFYSYFNIKNQNYLKNNFKDYLKTIPLKIKFILFRLNKDNLDRHHFEKKGTDLRYSNIINKFFLNLAIIVCIYNIVKNYKKILHQKTEIYFLSILLLNLLPHLYAWATNKHLVGIFILSNLYIVNKLIIQNKI
ncbi:MAG: hypothetical protein CMN00_06165 [Rickettsiales bacterium]|nr:hypothetical protein [Rickettsiales bacterium]|tara:strand:- start:2475 stop:3770 length:1296 start_codon:yes stop_codon:yes gene_type:complete